MSQSITARNTGVYIAVFYVVKARTIRGSAWTAAF